LHKKRGNKRGLNNWKTEIKEQRVSNKVLCNFFYELFAPQYSRLMSLYRSDMGDIFVFNDTRSIKPNNYILNILNVREEQKTKPG